MTKIYIILFCILWIQPIYCSEISDTLKPNHGDKYIIDDFPDFNNRGFRYYQDYIDFSSEKDGYKLYVNAVNGNLYYQRIDFESEEIGFPIRIAFTYNSGSSYKGRFGNFWQFNYGIRLISNNANKNKIFVYPDDKTEIFLYNPTEKKYSPTNLFNESLKISENDGYEVSFSDDLLFGYKSNLTAVFKPIDLYFPSALKDIYGNEIYFNYFEPGKLKSILFQSGRSIIFQYEGDLVRKIIVPGGKEITYSYGIRGNLLSVNLPSGKYLDYTYDECNNLIKITTEKNDILIGYDSDYRVISIQNHYLDQIFNFDYDTLNKKTTLILPDKSTRYFKYDRFERSIENGFENEPFAKLSWNDKNLLSSKTNGNGNSTTYSYDYLNRILSITYPDNVKTNYLWDDVNKRLTFDYRSSLKSEFYFDRYGEIKTFTKSGNENYSFNRDANGLLTDINLGEKINAKLFYDVFGQIKRININNLNQLLFNYNNDEQITEIKDLFNNSTFFTYDDYNKLISIKYPDSTEKGVYYFDNYQKALLAKRNKETVSYSFDKINRLINITDELNQKIDFEYKNFNQISILKDSLLNTINYNKYGLINDINIANQLKYLNSYDNSGNLISHNINGLSHSFKYNSLSDIIEYTNPGNSSKRYVYNKFRKVNQYINESNISTLFNYDDSGNLINKTIGNININIEYFLNNLVKYVYYNNSKELAYEYDDFGLITKYVKTKDTVIEYKYDLNGLKKKTILNNKIQSDYFYNLKYLIDSISFSSGNYLKIVYDNENKIIRKADKSGDYSIYNYDKKSRLSQITNEIGSTINYSWDNSNNLNSFKDKNSNEYLFEFKQNRIKITNPNNTIYNYEGNNLGEFFQITKILNTSNNVINILYDNNLTITNLIDDNAKQISINFYSNGLASSIINGMNETFKFTYDVANRPVNINNPENHNKTFAYNYNNQIVELSDYSLNKYQIQYYNSNKIQSITSGNLKLNYNYNELNQLYSFSVNDVIFLQYKYDLSGNIYKIINQYGDSTELNYNIFNKLVKKSNPDGESLEIKYSKNNLINQIKSSNKYTLRLNYDFNDNLAGILLDTNEIINFKYNNINAITGVVSIDKNFNYQYNSVGQIQQINLSSAYFEQLSYDYLGRVISRRYYDDKREQINYDSKSNILKLTNSNGQVYEFQYNYRNDFKTIRWARNDSINIEYFYDGNIYKIIYPNNTFSEFSWSPFNKLNSVNLFNSGYFDFKYLNDIDFTQAKMIISQGDSVSYIFDKLSRFKGVAGTGYQRINYDKTGRNLNDYAVFQNNITKQYEFKDSKLYRVFNSENMMMFNYNDNSFLPKSVIVNKFSYNLNFDNKLRLNLIKNGNTILSEFLYNSYGLISSINNNNDKFYFSYNNSLLLSKITRNNEYNLNINYNSSNYIDKIYDNFGNSFVCNYDNKGNLIRVTKNDNKKLEYLFDNNSNLIIKTNETLDEVGYYYNKQNLVFSSIYPDLSTNEITYNKLLSLKSLKTDRSLKLNYNFESKSFGFLNKTEVDINNLFNYNLAIDANNLLKLNNSSISQKIYDINNQLKTITLPNNLQINISNNDNVRKILLPNGISYSIEMLDDKSERIKIIGKNDNIISDILINYNENQSIEKITENSVEIIKNQFDNYKRINSWFKNGTQQYRIKYSPDSKIEEFNSDNQTIIQTYDTYNRLISTGEIDINYDQRGNIISKHYNSDNKILSYLYNFDNQLINIVNRVGDTTNIFYSPTGKLIGFKKGNYNFKIPINQENENLIYSHSKIDSTGDIQFIKELIEPTGSKIYYKYDFKSFEFIYPILSKNLTTIGFIDNSGNFISCINKISPFKFDNEGLSDSDFILFNGMVYYPEFELYFDGTKFYDAEIYSYLQEQNFIDKSLNSDNNQNNFIQSNQNSFCYAIPDSCLVPDFNPFNNRFTNLSKEANPYKEIENEINLHFNNFQNYNTLIFADFDMARIEPFSNDFVTPKNFQFNNKSNRNIVSTVKLPELMLDTMLLQSNYKIVPELMPERPNSKGVQKIYDYLKLTVIPQKSIINIVLEKILSVQNPFEETIYNNIHKAYQPEIDLEIVEFILKHQNSFNSVLKDNFKYREINPKQINYLEILKKYLPNYFKENQNEYINVLSPEMRFYNFSSKFINLDDYFDDKTNIINSAIKYNLSNILKNSFSLDIRNIIPGMENYNNQLIPLPYSKPLFPKLNSTYLEKKYINFEYYKKNN